VAGDEPFMRDNVVVDKDDDFTNRRLDAGLLCQGLPDALTMKDRLETRLALGDLLQILERAIPTPVDHDEHFRCRSARIGSRTLGRRGRRKYVGMMTWFRVGIHAGVGSTNPPS
jgi:hypothetical protein